MAVALSLSHHHTQSPHNLLRDTFSRRWPATMDQPSSSKPSLPSISSLIEAVKDQPDGIHDKSPKYEHERKLSVTSIGNPTSPDRPSLIGSPRSHPPESPSLPPASSFNFTHHSPGNASPRSAAHPTNFYGVGNASTNPELYAQPRSSYPPIPEANQWPPSQRRQSAESSSTEPSRPPPPLGYSEPVADGPPTYPGLSQQRPLPANFPPPVPGQPLPPIDPQMTPTWQHHHYYPPTNPPSYPQSQERYICPTCAKPFSRPSSLKIHTYSHTGEKPYRCKYEGCGKYFSVRSNMKRHEKGCHGGESTSAEGRSPKTSN